MYKIFLVEDDSGIAGAITQRAKAWDFDVYTRQNLHDIREEFASFNPHLVLLDISLPFFDGYHWCGEIRKSSKSTNNLYILHSRKNEYDNGNEYGRR